MTLVFGGVLLCSAGIQEVLSPAGDAMVRIVDSRELTVTGRLAAAGTACSKFHKTPPWVLRAGNTSYRLNGAVRPDLFAGKQVRIRGVFHETSGILDVWNIMPVGNGGRFPLDRAENAP